MLTAPASATSEISHDREMRVQAILAKLRPEADDALRRMAEALADAPDAQLFGPLELQLRDLGHDIANAAHQAGLDDRKKRATEAPVGSVRTAATTPSS